ncbi:MAG: RNA polymerase sigma factor [Planctomycetota bacterium]|jgi:RNA polymerase sigma-70 factor (ECF subfamily)
MGNSRAQPSPETLLGHADFVRAVARGLLTDEHRIDDVVQETWLAALRGPPRADWGWRAWLAGVARNLARRQVREETRRRARERAGARRGWERATAEIVASEATRRRVVQAVLALDEPYRTAVLLRYYDDLAPREIARRLGSPGATVRSHLRRGLEKLRAALDAEHGGDRRAWCVALALYVKPARGAAVAAGGLAMKKLVVAGLVILVAVVALYWRPWWPAPENAGRAARPHPEANAAATATVEPEAERAPPPVAEAPRGPRVHVVSAAGEDVSGAEVVALHRSGATLRRSTDTQGRAPLRRDFAGDCTFWVAAEGYGLRLFKDVAVGPAETRLVLEPGGRVRLRFVTRSGEERKPLEAQQRFAAAALPGSVHVISDEGLDADGVMTATGARYRHPLHWRLDARIVWSEQEVTLAHPLAPGRWRLFVDRPGATPLALEPFLVEAGRTTEVSVPLHGEPDLRRVRFLDAESGAALAGAKATPYTSLGRNLPTLAGHARVADEHGEVWIPIKEQAPRTYLGAPSWVVEAEHHLGSFSDHKLFTSKPGTTVEVRVPKAGAIAGRAYLPSGAPAAGREVVYERIRDHRARVAADGTFRIAPVPPPQHGVRVALVEDPATGKVRIGRVDADREVVIGSPEGGATLQGTITAGGVGVAVSLMAGSGSPRGPTGQQELFGASDADGRFEIAGIPPGRGGFHIALGNLRASKKYRIRGQLEFAAGQTERLEIRLPPGVLRVRVVDAATGAPLEGARAVGYPADRKAGRERFPEYEFRPGWSGFTDADGVVSLLGLPETVPHVVRARAQGYAETTLADCVPGRRAAPTEVTVRLARRG